MVVSEDIYVMPEMPVPELPIEMTAFDMESCHAKMR